MVSACDLLPKLSDLQDISIIRVLVAHICDLWMTAFMAWEPRIMRLDQRVIVSQVIYHALESIIYQHLSIMQV